MPEASQRFELVYFLLKWSIKVVGFIEKNFLSQKARWKWQNTYLLHKKEIFVSQECYMQDQETPARF